MLQDFLKYIEKNKICRKEDRILLAVSGGIDSMVMAHLFISGGFKPAIAHCNFSLRGEESDKDEKLVRKLASDYNIPLYFERFETKKYAREKGISVQMAARELRYKWFETIRSLNNFDFVAVAHNLNDNIETLLINLVRGTGISGLTGMKPVSNRIIRPVLFATRHRIEEYCDLYRIPFREDRSNSDTKYTRNKIRHLVIPVLKEINSSVETTLDETAGRLSDTNEILKCYLEIIKEQATGKKGKSLTFNIKELQPFLHNKTLIFELFSPYGIKGSAVHDLVNVISGETGGRIITSTHSIIKNREELIIFPLSEKIHKIYCEINNTKEFTVAPGIESADIVAVTPGFKIPDEKETACIDLKKISFPLIIRRWEKGDSFFPLGMKNRKKLSDYFIDKKFSAFEKEEALILESLGEIIWIIGERIDDRYKITPSTTEVLRIKASETSNDHGDLKY